MAAKFKKGDKVIIITGADKGKIGNIIAIDGDKVVVEGVRIATIHKKPTQNQKGEILKKEKPIHISNVSHIDENDKPAKVGFAIEEGEGKKFTRKSRILRKTGKKID